MLLRLIATALAAMVALAGPVAAAPTSLDRLARDYVELVAEAGRIEPEQFGVGDDVKPIAGLSKDRALTRPLVVARLGQLVRRLDRLPPSADPMLAMRRRFLRAHAESLALQLQPDKMTAMPVAERVRRIYGFDPVFPELSTFDRAIDALDKALPGPGTLSDRIDALKKRAQVPPDRIPAVVGAAVAECRRRTAERLRLPKEELAISYPADPLVPGQANYVANGKGTMAVSTVVPADVDRLLQVACHEAYPGHHTHFATLDQRLWREKGWPEVRTFLAFDPKFPVSDAISEYGVGLTFPLDERMRFEREVLYPLAGLRMTDEPAWRALLSARSSVLGATSTVIRDYLDKKIDAEAARRLAMRYRLMNPRSAEQLIKMVDAFGVDVIASDQGWLAIDRAFAGKPVDEQWRLLQRMMEEPMLLDDVRALGSR